MRGRLDGTPLIFPDEFLLWDISHSWDPTAPDRPEQDDATPRGSPGLPVRPVRFGNDARARSGRRVLRSSAPYPQGHLRKDRGRLSPADRAMIRTDKPRRLPQNTEGRWSTHEGIILNLDGSVEFDVDTVEGRLPARTIATAAGHSPASTPKKRPAPGVTLRRPLSSQLLATWQCVDHPSWGDDP